MADKNSPRDPKPLGDLLPILVNGRGWKGRLAVGRLRDAWAEIVGPHVAAHSEPVRLQQGTLTIRVEPGAWASELTLLGASLATRSDAFLGSDGMIRQVQIQAGSTGSSRA
jgi:predicted nucleic acid-binding Zn ribbon protein